MTVERFADVRLRGCLAYAAAAAVLATPAQSWAQTASQITPPRFAPPVEERPAPPLALPADTLRAAPDGAEDVFLTPAELAVTGGALAPATLAALRARLVGRRVSLAEVFSAAGAAEAAEARTGRVLVRVVVPRQELADGATLRLAVVEGFVERIDVAGVPARVRGRVAALLADLAGRGDVTLAQIDRRLTLASDLPGVRLRSTLAAGERPGGTVLRIDGTWRPVMGFVSVDNTLPEALGRTGYGLGVDFNSVLGAGELIFLRASGLPNTGRRTSVLDPTPRNRALAGGIILPLGTDGLTLTVEGTDARTAPRPGASLPGFGSRFQRLSYTLRYPLVRRRSLTIGVEGSFDAQDERVRIIDPVVLPLSRDRLRILRAAGDVNAWLAGGGSIYARAELSRGVDALGARSAADAGPLLPLSRAGSDAAFTKLLVTAGFDQPVARYLELGLRGRAQTSFGKPLGNAEQLGIASLDAVSPLATGRLQGDAGYVLRGEARAPFAFGGARLAGRLAPYAFASTGTVRFERPTVFERSSTDVFAYGAGMRFAAQGADGSPGLSASLEYGRVHLVGRRPDRVSFTIVARF